MAFTYVTTTIMNDSAMIYRCVNEISPFIFFFFGNRSMISIEKNHEKLSQNEISFEHKPCFYVSYRFDLVRRLVCRIFTRHSSSVLEAIGAHNCQTVFFSFSPVITCSPPPNSVKRSISSCFNSFLFLSIRFDFFLNFSYFPYGVPVQDIIYY